MSRVAKSPIKIPQNVNISLQDLKVIVHGKLGILKKNIHKCIKIIKKNSYLFFSHNHSSSSYGWMQAGTCRALVNTMIIGVTTGFKKQLILFGIGYRVILENNNILKLYLGFSHSISYQLPNLITANLLSQTEIVLSGINKQLVGQVAANIRSYRKPEPYKGKGIRYLNEIIRIKEAKKK
ncbi:50S ribosomal protein L6 [Buchnera aphidicola]|uniref:50S ribosomal protein L6 n=2 Tax=Buchnera aphidicola (Cinara cedri) TaxID=261318 RepID=Q057B9_BUCCC|nr:50S ribosomal protein L6 [Buchnera aphidicola]AAW72692.1 50S ribosomal protein L6 [Buchnera aphidicola (Cinara cedri)]ABJ90780.1 50S ribosomal protein L6 [Buchnera aphidicola BCc]